MNKKFKWICILLALICFTTIGLAACGGGGGGGDVEVDDDGNIITPGGKVTSLVFWANGESTEHEVFKAIVDKFNDKYKGQIQVTLLDKAGNNYGQMLEMQLNGRNGPDIFYVGDSSYKHYAEAGYLYDITEDVKKSEQYNTTNMWDSAVSRYLYDVNTGRSGTAEGHYYGVPKDIGPTVIFYNETIFEGAGITCFSVGKDDLAAFNAGTKTDDRGNSKQSYGMTEEVKEKGFFKMGTKYYFNNQIPMSWEETVECANMVQDYMRLSDPLACGYYTEWWFNYGWTVGGDVIQEIPTNDPAYSSGYFWDFTLMDNTKNYIVPDGGEDVTVNGKTYHEGEVIAYTDKLDMSNYAKNSTEAKNKKGEYSVSGEVITLRDAGKLNELPSQREAFAEFVRLAAKTTETVDGKPGYAISANPSTLGSDAKKNEWFRNGRIGMLVDGRWNVTIFREKIGETEADSNQRQYFKWDVAPLPIYKQYDSNGNVTVHSIEGAGHSGSVALCINAKSSKKTAAWLFLEYCASIEGQTMQADAGFAIPLDKSLAATDTFLQPDKFPYNSKIFLQAAAVEKAGDWWLLPDGEWIDDWANLLNGSVRNGKTSFDAFYASEDYNSTFGKLDKYCKK